MQVAFENGTMEVQQWQTDEIILTHHVIHYHRFENHRTVHDDDFVRLHFGLQGDCQVKFNHLGKTYELKAGQHNIMYTQGFDIEVYNQTKQIETFGIRIPKQVFVQYAENGNEALKRFCEKIVNGENTLMTNHWKLPNLPIRQVIQEIIQNRLEGGLQKLFLLSKSIELLVLQAQQLGFADENSPKIIKTKTDQEKIIEARHIITTRYQAPPTLSGLAKEIGMNECKLKQGFKETFETTVFGYLTQLRMTLAMQSLRDTDKTIKEIAYELGYSSPQHFSHAFKKQFGKTPNFVRQTP